MLDMVLDTFEVEPDHDLSIMKERQTLFDITSNIMLSIRGVLEKERRTQSWYTEIRRPHLRQPWRVSMNRYRWAMEAGLRTYDIYSPYPEEFNRQATGIIAKYTSHPTEKARQNLLREGKLSGGHICDR